MTAAALSFGLEEVVASVPGSARHPAGSAACEKVAFFVVGLRAWWSCPLTAG